jgi:hypothetical protein
MKYSRQCVILQLEGKSGVVEQRNVRKWWKNRGRELSRAADRNKCIRDKDKQ